MSSVFDSYLGAAREQVYGTAVAVNRFFELGKESIKAKYDRIEAEGVRSGSRVLSADRFVPNPKGAEGGIDLEVLDRGYGFWFDLMLGKTEIGTAANGVTPFKHTIADLRGKSFTAQVGRVGSTGTLAPFTFSGGKIKTWELSNQVDGVLSLAITADFAREHVPAAGDGPEFQPATVVYPDKAKLFTYLGGTITLGGTTLAAKEVSLKGDNGVKDDRWSIGIGKREPLEEKLRVVSFDLKGEFESIDSYRRVSAATAEGALASIVLTWAGVPLAGGGVPFVKVEIPAARFDEGDPNIDGLKTIDQTLSGVAVESVNGPAVTLTYGSPDTAL